MRALALGAIASLVFAAACGEPPPAAAPSPHLTSLERDLQCSEQPELAVDGIAVAVGCPFEQQAYNIRTHGAPIGTKPVTMMDANGRIDGKLTHECGAWLLGMDPSGADVIIHRSSGEVRSHGTFHAGQPLSSLPSSLAVPLSF
jgi:hypothetical protein